MFAALVLAGVCSLPPLFDDSGPVCVAARQAVECGCTECMDWPPVLVHGAPGDPDYTPAAEWYELSRDNPDGTTANVGSTIWRNHAAFVDEDGGTVPALVATRWCFAWDVPFPVEGLTYRYRVRACTANACSAWGSDLTTYTAAPYACYSAAPVPGREVPCYPGDVVFRP